MGIAENQACIDEGIRKMVEGMVDADKKCADIQKKRGRRMARCELNWDELGMRSSERR